MCYLSAALPPPPKYISGTTITSTHHPSYTSLLTLNTLCKHTCLLTNLRLFVELSFPPPFIPLHCNTITFYDTIRIHTISKFTTHIISTPSKLCNYISPPASPPCCIAILSHQSSSLRRAVISSTLVPLHHHTITLYDTIRSARHLAGRYDIISTPSSLCNCIPPPAPRPTRDFSTPHSSLSIHITQSLNAMKSSSTPTSSYRTSATYSTHPPTSPRHTSTATSRSTVVDTYPSTSPRHISTPTSRPAVVSTYPSMPPHRTSTPTSRPAAVDTSAPASGSFHNHNVNTSSTSRTITTNCTGYKSVIDKARAIQKEDAESLHQAAKARHAHKLRRAKGERERADEAAIRNASSSNLNIDAHYQQLLVEIKKNVKATFEAEWIAQVREDVYGRYPQIASEYEAQIKDETYTFLVDSLEPVVKADLRQQLEPQIREELREELMAQVRAGSSAQHEARTTVCHQVDAGSGRVNSKAVQTVEETTKAVIDPSSSTIPTHDTLDVNVGANDFINDLDDKLAEEVNTFVREVTDEVDGLEGSHDHDAQCPRPELAHLDRPGNYDANEPDKTHGEHLNAAQFQRHQSPLMASVESQRQDASATPYDNRFENQSASRSQSVDSKRSWSSEDDYEENESPSKRRKYSPENEDETVPWPFDDEQHTNSFQQQGSASPPSSDDYFDSEDEEHQDVITPGPFVQLAPQFGQPGSLIAQTNTADEAWLIPDSDDEEGVKGEVEGGGTLVETGFVSVNKAGIDVRANELFLSEGNDG